MEVSLLWRLGPALLCSTCLAGCVLASRPSVTPDGRAIVRIVFVGDSLIHRSQADHEFLTRIQQELERAFPEGAFDVVDAGVNGNRIADIHDRLQRDVLDLRPAAVVLYWDSDVSDVDEDDMSPAERRTTRTAYSLALEDVLARLVSSHAHVIVSGPTLLGERPHGRNPKDRQADAYRRINHQLAARFGATYIDTRHAFQSSRPGGAPVAADRGLLTEDGEHLNEQGTRVAAGAFVRALEGWLHRRRAAATGP